VGRLRAILILRGVLASFFLVLGIVLLLTGNTVFGVFAIVVALVNTALIVLLAKRTR
jgi:hypothetical protein